MTFSTEKNKFFKIWNDSIENQFEIDNLSTQDKIIFNKVNDLNNTNMTYNSIINFTSDWITPNTITLKNNTDFILDIFQEYEVILNGIDQRLLPYIESKIIYRVGDGSVPIPSDPIDPSKSFDEALEEFEINSITEIHSFIEEINGEQVESQTLKTITYRTSIYLRETTLPAETPGLPGNLQFKFFVNIFNPFYYQSTS